MIFLTTTIPNAVVMNNIFQKLAITIGLYINRTKSKVYFSRDVPDKNQILSTLGMIEDSLPIKYLGVPYCVDYIHASDCTFYETEFFHNLKGGIVLCYQLQAEKN